MRLLITGVNGLLGSNLARCLRKRGHIIAGTGRQPQSPASLDRYVAGDLLEPHFAGELLAQTRPDVLINCVGLANVNLCESDPALARAINVDTAAHVAEAASLRRVRLLHISTDHLFSGDLPFRTETDVPVPVNQYGKTKWEGEKAVLAKHPGAAIIRTNFFGWSPGGHPATFAEWLFQGLSARTPIHLYTNYFFNSIEVSYLSAALEEVARSAFHGVLNIAGSERSSKYEFAKAMAEVFNLSMDNAQASSFEADTMQVPRPRDLSLSVKLFQTLFKSPLPMLQQGLVRLQQERADFAARSAGASASLAKRNISS